MKLAAFFFSFKRLAWLVKIQLKQHFRWSGLKSELSLASQPQLCCCSPVNTWLDKFRTAPSEHNYLCVSASVVQVKAAVIGSVVRWLAHPSQNRTQSRSFQEQPSSSAVNVDKRSATAQTGSFSHLWLFLSIAWTTVDLFFPHCAYFEDFTSKYGEILILTTSPVLKD